MWAAQFINRHYRGCLMVKWLFSKSFSSKDPIIGDHLKIPVLFRLLGEILGFIQSALLDDISLCQIWGQAFDILNHLYMEHRDDDDEDVSFAKWMSSFWGHSWIEEDERGLRDRHRSQHASYRKTSLPCPVSYHPGTGRAGLGRGFLLHNLWRFLWYEVFFGWKSVLPNLFYTHKNHFYHFMLSSKGPDFHLFR